jgi:acyl-CoA dehydrogenase
VNLPVRWTGGLLRALVFPGLHGSGREFTPPDDALETRVARTILEPSPTRERIARGVFVSRHDENDAVALLEQALAAAVAAEPLEERVRRARRGAAPAAAALALDQAVADGVLSHDEGEVVRRAATLRRKAIMVEDFPADLGTAVDYRTTRQVTFEALQAQPDMRGT